MADRVVMQRAAFLHRHADQTALGAFGRLADCFGHFARLAGAVADAAFLIADDDECRECETTAALHDFCDAVDGDQLVDQLVAAVAVAIAAMVAAAAPAAIAATAFARFTCHAANPLE